MANPALLAAVAGALSLQLAGLYLPVLNDLLKTRPGYFRASDHQLMHEMYAVTALPADKIKNQWDIFTSSPAVPGPDEDLEMIAATKEENSCTFPS